MSLWNRSSLSQSEEWTQVAGDTPTEIGQNFALTVNTEGMNEAALLQAAIEDAENWSDDPIEQGQYLFGLKWGLGL